MSEVAATLGGTAGFWGATGLGAAGGTGLWAGAAMPSVSRDTGDRSGVAGTSGFITAVPLGTAALATGGGVGPGGGFGDARVGVAAAV